MSCQIHVAAHITDVGAIRRCLFPTDDSRGSDSWLQSCELSVSPVGDIIAIANERRLVILSSKWDATSSLSQFYISFSGSVHESDNIKAVVCLPVVGQIKNSHVVPDWTCVLLGFDSGFLRFYTENCELLLEQQLHNEVVASIKCRSQHNPRPDLSPDFHPEEIYVQYQSTVCVIAGSQLFPTLRLWRGELARVQAKGDTLEASQGDIVPKKWGFEDQANINDIAVVGVNLHGTFDHLLTASICGGFESKYRSAAPYNNLVLAAGSRPFLGYHYALEGCPQPVFSDVAKAVATKLKSALPGWLTGGKSVADNQMTVAMQPSETMGCRFGLCDLRRTATSIALSPDHKLAAVSDALGRVLLIDAFRGITLRIFKGYRDAQCGFVQAPDERPSKHRAGNKVALFLVIYSPKRGTIEIFTVQQGQKITTFSASKFSRLIYNNYGLMGFDTTSKSRFVCQFDAVLIDNDGKIKEVSIPFHFALSEKNNKRARDVHLFKKLKLFLKHEFSSESVITEVEKICSELKTSEVKLQTLELLISHREISVEALLKSLEHFLDSGSDSLEILSENVRLLLVFYLFAKDATEDRAHFDQKLKLDSKQLTNLQKLLDLSTSKVQNTECRVGFVESKVPSPSEFLSAFNLTNSNAITLKLNLDDSLSLKVSKLIFDKYIRNPILESFVDHIQASKVPIKDLFSLLISYWVERPPDAHANLQDEMNNLLAVITILSGLQQDSDFWCEIRDILAGCASPFPALTAAILCKMAAEECDSADDDSNIEILSQESIEWSLLIGKLEDVSLLSIVLSNEPSVGRGTLPKLHREVIDVSLRYVLEKGKGSVSELVARWLCFGGVDPANLVLNDVLLRRTERDEVSEADDDDDLPEQDVMPHKQQEIRTERVFELLNLLKCQFPYSLEASMVLANMCWEYSLAWQRDIAKLDKLEAGIDCLAHVTNSHVREGMYNLVWNTHLKILFESASKLVNKVGKLPKERLCKQDTGLTDYQLVIFLGIATNFLDAYMEAVQQSYGKVKPRLQFEGIWEDGPRPLVELALQQNPINYDLLHLHYQLSVTLQMITSFSIKHSKPLNNLFESYMLGLFFVDFQTKAQINWNYADSKVQASRTQFLFKVISASVENVSVTDEKLYAAEHINWMGRCLEMARLWNLELDLFRRHEIVQVYVSGLDSFGDELYGCVQEKNKLGPELLAVAAKRLSKFLTTSPTLCQNVAALSTVVTRYMEQLNGDWCAPSSLVGIENLANRSLSCLDETQPAYKVAELLLDGCQTLQTIHKSVE